MKKVFILFLMVFMTSSVLYAEGRSVSELKTCLKDVGCSLSKEDLSKMNGKKINKDSGDFLWDMQLEAKGVSISEAEKEHLIMGKPYKNMKGGK